MALSRDKLKASHSAEDEGVKLVDKFQKYLHLYQNFLLHHQYHHQYYDRYHHFLSYPLFRPIYIVQGLQ